MFATTLHDLTPFGSPDGSRANLEDITKGFVNFGNPSAWGGLSTPPDDLTARVLVGRKGSGKTVYLRRLRAHAVLEKSLYADNIQQDLPTTENVVKYCQWFPKDILTEKWMDLWRKAILRSLTSHILCNKHLSSHTDTESRRRLSVDFKDLIRPYTAHVSVYSQVNEIINDHYSRPSVEKFLAKPTWNELETVLADVLSGSPPICFYLDAVDEEFAHAPMYWLRCQKGLFYQTMRFVRDSQLGSRLHLIICMRDIVLASVFKSEHQTRYRGEPHIRILSWNRRSIQYFLEQKLTQLDDRLFAGDCKNGKTPSAWLGIKEVKHLSRGGTEPIMQYLLRPHR